MSKIRSTSPTSFQKHEKVFSKQFLTYILLFIPPYLKDSDGVGVRQPLHENTPLAPSEVSPLDAVAVGFGPVQPVVIGSDPIWPADAFRHYAGHIGSIHVAPVNTSCLVAPVRPKHQTVRV